jgi:hypothetical protein
MPAIAPLPPFHRSSGEELGETFLVNVGIDLKSEYLLTAKIIF